MDNGRWTMENEHSESGHLKSGGVENVAMENRK